MALDLYNIIKGLEVSATDLSTSTYVLQGAGAPGGDGDVQDAAGVGSLYMRNDVNAATGEQYLQIYWKHTVGSGADKWALAASKEYVDATSQGLSWREPVTVLDSTTYASSSAFPTTGVVDGVTLANGDRVLFTNVTAAGEKNVWIWNAGTSSWTEDTNAETDGDALLVNEGTRADQQWVFDGTNWIQFGGAASTEELTYIRTFIGKNSSGSETPDYPSNDIVVDGNSLESEIGRLDNAIGTMQFTTPSVLTSYDGAGFPASNYDVTYNLKALDDTYGSGLITNIGSNYALTDEMQWNASGTLTLTDALNALNNAIGNRDYTGNILTDGQTITQSLEEIDITIGDIDNSSAYTAGGYLPAATIAGNSVQQTFNTFNQVLGDFAEQTYVNNVTNISTTTNLESGTLAETEATEVKWILQYRDYNGGSPSTRRRAVEIHAVSDGSGTVDFNLASVLRTGTAITGVNITVAISGGVWQVNLDPGSNVLNATLKRVTYSFLG
jgi:hypothetical protein